MLSTRRVVNRYLGGQLQAVEAILEISTILDTQPMVRHAKTGGLYYVQADNAMLQWPNKAYDTHSMTVYYPVEAEKDPLYTRLTNEFMDGRFVRV